MIIHIDRVKGDFIINEWDDDGYKQLKEKQNDLESLGYKLVKNNMDYLNEYFVYEKDNDIKVITFCRC